MSESTIRPESFPESLPLPAKNRSEVPIERKAGKGRRREGGRGRRRAQGERKGGGGASESSGVS